MPLFPHSRRAQPARAFTPSESRVSSLDRVIFFSDAVHSIAITLLTIQITVPAVSADDLGSALADNWREYFAYALSFFVIGLYWLTHHRIFDLVVREDRTLLRLNLLLLGCVAFIPFPTAVLGRYGDQSAAVTAYAATLAATGFTWAALWWWMSSGRRLIDERLRDGQVRALQGDLLLTPLIFAASIPVAQWNASAAEFLWIAIIPAGAVSGRFFARAGEA